MVITHDLRTMVRDAWARVQSGDPMPGVVFIAHTTPVGTMLDILTVVVEAGDDAEDFRNRVLHLP